MEVRTYEPPRPGKPPPSSYSVGQRIIVDIVNFVEKLAPNDPETIKTAKLNLADWHKLFGSEAKATRMYRDIWKELDSLPTVREVTFDKPKLLYIRLPEFEASSDSSAFAVVELLLTVSYRGAVTGRISQVVDPPNTDIEFRTQVAARVARFRPAMKDGKPLTTRDFLLTHHYPLPMRNPQICRLSNRFA